MSRVLVLCVGIILHTNSLHCNTELDDQSIIVHVNDKTLTYKRMNSAGTKLQYEYEFGCDEIVSVTCLKQYKNDPGKLAFTYTREKTMDPYNQAEFNNDLAILNYSPSNVTLGITVNCTYLIKRQSITCRIENSQYLQAEILLIRKPGAEQSVCNLSSNHGPCRNFKISWFFNMTYGVCTHFWYGGCEGNGNKFATKEKCEDICVNPAPQDACFLPNATGPCGASFVRWYFNTTMKQCMPFIYGGCLGNANKFITKELCENQCGPNETTTETSTAIIPHQIVNENNTALSVDDRHTKNQTETHDTRDKDVTTGGSTVIIGCAAGIIAAAIGSGCMVFWRRRKRNNSTPNNECTNLAFRDVDPTTLNHTPESRNSLDNCSPTYDYAYNINKDTVGSPHPPDPCRRIKPKIAAQQEKCRNSTDSESNYYCEIDDYFIKKREALQQQKKKKLCKK